MTLTTHAIAGAAVVSLLPAHPVLGIILAFASHFALDMIPHYDYAIKSRSVHPQIGEKMKADKALFMDMLRIGSDGLLGTLVAIIAFHTFIPLGLLLAGAFFGMVPDPLQFVYAHFKHEPLISLQKFHQWIHTKYHLLKKPALGFVSQLLIACCIISLTFFLKRG